VSVRPRLVMVNPWYPRPPSGGGPGVVRTDPGRTVERLLLELGRARLAPAEVAEVERSLAAP
jgi:hypothetical protein